ncbi:hypothetical protein [Streptosporangium subroseum]|uniref:hypothetical protein n=1 Tax=Streptosporangium subroseum TaxID=106412 RepID=UPI00309366E8|nr:hypothetical protein OHB15_31470 [Streptosporangium subroseum]
MDHRWSWWRDGKIFAVMGEPCDLNRREVADCDPYDLKVEVSAEYAVHFPLYTVALIVMRSEDSPPYVEG